MLYSLLHWWRTPCQLDLVKGIELTVVKVYSASIKEKWFNGTETEEGALLALRSGRRIGYWTTIKPIYMIYALYFFIFTVCRQENRPRTTLFLVGLVFFFFFFFWEKLGFENWSLYQSLSFCGTTDHRGYLSVWKSISLKTNFG